MTKERPILFSGAMVRAILDGRKTQTRRVANVPAEATDVRYWAPPSGRSQPGWADPGLNYWTPDSHGATLSNHLDPCPYGQPGDRLWVRESFWGCDAPGYGDQPCVVYDDEWHGKEYRPAEVRPWARKFGRIPSIHMPRDCSRITLEITGVRVERLNNCSEADAIAEGIAPELEGWTDYSNPSCQMCLNPVDSYRTLWDSINGAGAWEANPWVWVVEFRKV